jgi:hypothetical protein
MPSHRESQHSADVPAVSAVLHRNRLHAGHFAGVDHALPPVRLDDEKMKK